MGGIYALSANQASQRVSVTGSVFADVSGGAIHIGSSGFPHWLIAPSPDTPPNDQDSQFHIADNLMHNIPVEFHGAIAGVFAGYVSNSTIEHNTITNASYTGISVGWGWGARSYSRGNLIQRNRIDGVMFPVLKNRPGCLPPTYRKNGSAYPRKCLPLNNLADGGHIYTQEIQQSTIFANYLSHDENRYGGIYHDGGGLWNDSHNVLNHNGHNWTVETYPGMGRHKVPAIFVHGARNTTIDFLWYNDTDQPCCGGSAMACRRCDTTPGYYMGHAHNLTDIKNAPTWPPAAQVIVDMAGRREL